MASQDTKNYEFCSTGNYMSYENFIIKAAEELGEVANEYKKIYSEGVLARREQVLSEVFDLMQVCATFLEGFNIEDVEKAQEKHSKKMEKRWVKISA